MTNETYPYPLRPSELVRNKDWLDNIKPLNLNEEDRNQIREFETSLFSRLKTIKDISIATHVIYLDFFKTDKGKRIFASIYLDPALKERMGNEDPASFFESLTKICDSEKSFEEYRDGKFPRPGDLSNESIKNLFQEIDLSRIPEKIRKKVNSASANYAEEQFKEEFKKEKGNIQRVRNPERIAKVVEPDKLKHKLSELRSFKQEIKKIKESLGNDNDMNKAKFMVLNLYQKYLNVLIAKEAEDERISLNEVRKIGPKTMERIDHFLAGVGLNIRKDKMFATIPLRLARYAGSRIREEKPEQSAEYQKYNSYKVSSENLAKIIKLTLHEYGLDQGEKPWTINIEKGRKTLSVSGKSKQVNIPDIFDRNLVDTLGTVAHEVEGHVIRFRNQEESKTGTLKIIEELSTGRSGILSEGAAMRIEDETTKEISNHERPANPYYYLAIARKERGGGFRACMKTIFEARAKRFYGVTTKEAVENDEIFKDNFEYAYTRTLRIFRRNTPLDDASGFTPISDQLEYIEQELVLDILLSEENKQKGIDKILYISGIDLYSIQELMSLGMLDLNKVKKPEMVVAKKIWPKIKEALDSGQTIEEALKVVI